MASWRFGVFVYVYLGLGLCGRVLSDDPFMHCDPKNVRMQVGETRTIDICYLTSTIAANDLTWSGPFVHNFSQSKSNFTQNGVRLYYNNLTVHNFRPEYQGEYFITASFDSRSGVQSNINIIKVCQTGKYGTDCDQCCSPHCEPGKQGQSPCDPVNGKCISGCQEGYTGDLCLERDDHTDDDNSLGPGDVAAIILGIILLVLLVLVALYLIFIVYKKKCPESRQKCWQIFKMQNDRRGPAGIRLEGRQDGENPDPEQGPLLEERGPDGPPQDQPAPAVRHPVPSDDHPEPAANPPVRPQVVDERGPAVPVSPPAPPEGQHGPPGSPVGAPGAAAGGGDNPAVTRNEDSAQEPSTSRGGASAPTGTGKQVKEKPKAKKGHKSGGRMRTQGNHNVHIKKAKNVGINSIMNFGGPGNSDDESDDDDDSSDDDSGEDVVVNNK